MRAGFAQFLAFSQDATDNKTFLAQGKLQMPVLALDGEATFGPMIGAVIRCVAAGRELASLIQPRLVRHSGSHAVSRPVAPWQKAILSGRLRMPDRFIIAVPIACSAATMRHPQ
jgi:hypothetical protein